MSEMELGVDGDGRESVLFGVNKILYSFVCNAQLPGNTDRQPSELAYRGQKLHA